MFVMSTPLIHTLLITLLFYGEIECREQTHSPTTHGPVPYCYISTGCAHAATCQCTLYLSQCSIEYESEGKCILTPFGMAVVIVACVVALFLVILVVCCLYCCFRKCCKCKKDGSPTSIINYHYHNPFTSPIETHNAL